MIRSRSNPLEAVFFGMLAGAIGSFVQRRLFAPAEKRSGRPGPSAGAGEPATDRFAGRLVEDFMRRGPLSARRRSWGGRVVHYSFGSAWGGAYGVLRESAEKITDRNLVLGFSLGVWLIADHLLLPTFQLAPWPWKRAPSQELKSLAAHLVYGAIVGFAYEELSRYFGSIEAEAPDSELAEGLRWDEARKALA